MKGVETSGISGECDWNEQSGNQAYEECLKKRDLQLCNNVVGYLKVFTCEKYTTYSVSF